ncbi:tryptophan synthase subunit alpha [Streptomyces sp. NBC_01281]|uniref:tryptophan synthase subunit alpha n=1 Tax=Streptomyces sp. NBC_01281 TaxID=2903811 RepID=UPI003DA3AF08
MRGASRPAFGAFSLAGYPNVYDSAAALVAFAHSGASLLEVGIPSVDPWLDGSVIRTAHEAALHSGDGVATAVETVRRITSEVAQPVYCMAYWSTVHDFGPRRLAEQLAAAGAAGCLIADVPLASRAAWVSAADAADLAAPLLVNRDARQSELEETSQAASGFIYAPAVHGQRTGYSAEIDLPALTSFVATVRPGARGTPVLTGIGVSTPALAAAVVSQCNVDGVVAGSPLIRALTEGGVPRAAALVSRFVDSIDATASRTTAEAPRPSPAGDGRILTAAAPPPRTHLASTNRLEPLSPEWIS